MLQRDGHDVAYMSLLDERDRAFFEFTFGSRLGNPDGFEGVHSVEIGPSQRPGARLAEVVASLRPDLLVAIGYPAALALRAVAEDTRLVYVTSGCKAAERLIADRKADDAVTLLARLEQAHATNFAGELDERAAIEGADHVMAHSLMTLRFVQKLYPRYVGRMHPVPIGFGSWIRGAAARYSEMARPFDDRSIGALFVASTWDRWEKNYAGVRRIAGRLPRGTIHVVGDVPATINGAVHHGFVPERAELFRLMGDARAVVCPSHIDAAPGILFEAAALGCNLVASRNCGNHEICHADLLSESRTPDSYAELIERALARPYPPLEAATGGYDELVEILAVA
jgi:glycosyltransferase involved in cell wall biosynthesis